MKSYENLRRHHLNRKGRNELKWREWNSGMTIPIGLTCASILHILSHQYIIFFHHETEGYLPFCHDPYSTNVSSFSVQDKEKIKALLLMMISLWKILSLVKGAALNDDKFIIFGS